MAIVYVETVIRTSNIEFIPLCPEDKIIDWIRINHNLYPIDPIESHNEFLVALWHRVVFYKDTSAGLQIKFQLGFTQPSVLIEGRDLNEIIHIDSGIKGLLIKNLQFEDVGNNHELFIAITAEVL